jgi:hypothetical protein
LKPQKLKNSENFNIFENNILSVENAKVVIVGSVFSFWQNFATWWQKRKIGPWLFYK